VGFPGETQTQFQSLLNFMKEIRFDRLGAFAYSLEEDTPAYDLPESLSETDKQERLLQVMDLQAKISQEKQESLIGITFDVLVDFKEKNSDIYHGRSIHSAPDQVDGEVLFVSKVPIKIGSFVKVKMTRHDEYDLFGELV
jgi:ribosomal protein S12 methylthiotransferase